MAYADDLALVITARDLDALRDKADEALRKVSDWMDDHGLQLAPAKCEALFLTGRKRVGELNLQLAGHPLRVVKSARYLGVELDTAMSGNAHIRKVAEKTRRVSQELAPLLPRVGGASQGRRLLYASIAESIALYASPVWADVALRTRKNRAALRSAQRVSAIGVTRAYRTVSTEVLLVLAKRLPWDLLAGERRMLYMDERLTLSEARQATLRAWQEEWSRPPLRGTMKGAWTRSLLPDLWEWYDAEHTELTYHMTQVLTGHGQFWAFLFKIRKVDSNVCVLCTSGQVDDVDHTVLRCHGLGTVRSKMPPELEGLSLRGIVAKMVASPEIWDTGIRWIGGIMRKKEELIRAWEQRERGGGGNGTDGRGPEPGWGVGGERDSQALAGNDAPALVRE